MTLSPNTRRRLKKTGEVAVSCAKAVGTAAVVLIEVGAAAQANAEERRRMEEKVEAVEHLANFRRLPERERLSLMRATRYGNLDSTQRHLIGVELQRAEASGFRTQNPDRYRLLYRIANGLA